MKKNFLPKELNGISNRRACFHINKGKHSTSPHWHDCIEIIFMKCGNAKIFFDGKWQSLNEGELFFAPPNSVHCCECADEHSEQIVIGFRDELICDTYSSEHLDIFPFYRQDAKDIWIIKNPAAAACALKLFPLKEADEFDTVTVYSLIISLYAEILKHWKASGVFNKKSTKNKTVISIEKYVRNHATEPITATGTAKAFNISYSYMAKLLSVEGGIAFCDMLLAARIDIAKRMIASTDKSITEIGFDCGFSATSAFIQSFKRMTGKTPLSYRKSYLENK